MAKAQRGKAKAATRAKKATSKPKTSMATTAIRVGKKPFTKSEFVTCIAEQTGLSRKDIGAVLESMRDVINAHLSKRGPETFALPGLFKIVVVNKPAQPARWGINPFTGEKTKFKAKPATRKVKIRPLKGLKEMAAKAA